MPKVRAAVQRALELDSDLSEAHTILATVQSFYDWDWTAGEASFRRAIQLEPGNASAHMFYSYYLTIRGRFDAAIQEIAIARRLDPLSLYTSVASLYPLYEGRRFDAVIAAANELLESEPNYWHTSMILGQALIWKKEYREAIAVLQRASDFERGQNVYCLAWLAVAHAATGDRVTALRILRQMREVEVKGEHTYLEAIIHVGLGEFEPALDLLEKSVDLRSEEVLMLGNDPMLDPLRSNPRFAQLRQRMGL
jgi:eukaryotic-like serine/threonine-protein kinase